MSELPGQLSDATVKELERAVQNNNLRIFRSTLKRFRNSQAYNSFTRWVERLPNKDWIAEDIKQGLRDDAKRKQSLPVQIGFVAAMIDGESLHILSDPMVRIKTPDVVDVYQDEWLPIQEHFVGGLMNAFPPEQRARAYTIANFVRANFADGTLSYNDRQFSSAFQAGEFVPLITVESEVITKGKAA